MSAATASTPTRRTATVQECLVALYMLADFARPERPPSPDFFARHGTLSGIAATPRRTVLRLARARECLACEASLSPNSTGDHLVALANGGPAGIENYVPLCGRCNSSKGTKDLLDWWYARSRTAAELAPDVLVLYARLMFAHCGRMDRLCAESSPGLLAAVRERVGGLPTEAHKAALRRRVAGLTGR